MTPHAITNRLVRELEPLRFGAPVTHVYNPLVYARRSYDAYTKAYAGRGQILLLGMNPGPYGMAQTGVPFGEVNAVRDWLAVRAKVDKPAREHPRRPVLGFDCPRSEVSGARLWGWARATYHTPARFFARFFVANYCPLVFMGATGSNITPDKLPARARDPLFAVCDRALRGLVEILEPAHVVGVGAFAAKRARAALDGAGLAIGRISHPSPASPAANRGWAALIERELRQIGVRP